MAPFDKTEGVKRVLSIKVSSDKILWGKWTRGNISLKRIRNAITIVKEPPIVLFF